jgi:hypothetical protein
MKTEKEKRMTDGDYVAKLVDQILTDRVRSAVKYVSPSHVVKATRKLYRGKIYKRQVDIVVTIGKPNYAEREFVKFCKTAQEPFPVPDIQLKFVKRSPK